MVEARRQGKRAAIEESTCGFYRNAMVMDQVELTFWEDRRALTNIGSSHRNQSRDDSYKALVRALNAPRRLCDGLTVAVKILVVSYPASVTKGCQMLVNMNAT